MQELRIGIVGTGTGNSIAKRFAKACAMTPGVRVTAVSSRKLDRALAFAEEMGIGQAYEGEEAMIESGNIDLVYVATPHTAHFDCCMTAVKLGMPVLCEKPISTNRQEAEILFAEARERNVFVMEGMWSRFLPNSIKAKQWIMDGKIGDLKFIDAMFSFAVDTDSPKPRLVEPSLGGGAMFDLGVYTIEMASYYAGADPVRWSGFAVPYCEGADALSVLSLEYPNGMLATLRMGITCEAPVLLTVYGTRGRIEIPRFFSAPEVRLYTDGTLTEQANLDCELPKGFVWEIAAVRECLTQGLTESPAVPATTSIRTAEIMGSMMKQFFQK